MTNKEIAAVFKQLGDVMELHGENPFKIRSYQNAYRTLRSYEAPVAELNDDDLIAIKGVGKAIAAKIRELLTTKDLETLKKYRDQTPEGVLEMLSLKGFGPKKVRTLWKDLGAESIGEVWYACHENRLVEIKGFGAKTQADLKRTIEYLLSSKGKFHFAALYPAGIQLLELMQTEFAEATTAWTGAFRRQCLVLERIELITTLEAATLLGAFAKFGATVSSSSPTVIDGLFNEQFPFRVHLAKAETFGNQHFITTGAPEWVERHQEELDKTNYATEEALVAALKLERWIPALREKEWLDAHLPQGVVQLSDIKGVIHNHTTYSDGAQTLAQMAVAARDQGFEYLVITDHSKSAFYAGGLKEPELRKQWAEIDELNAQLAPFKVFKGIESDILADGSLDYGDDLLNEFEVIIASVHSNLKMDEAKATERLLRAIAHPKTTILGHPTGRLLLSRKGYPIDHRTIIDACAEHGVAIELNANPYRLDLDWTWIPYAVEKGVLVSINPDAHSVIGYDDLQYGVFAAQKGGLMAQDCLPTKSLSEFETWLVK